MFISAYHDRRRDKVVVWERTDQGRVIREFPCPYYFYVPAKDGEFTALTGETLKKLTFSDRRSFDEGCLSYQNKFESDLNPLEKVLMNNYFDTKVPKLSIGFLDIEVDYDPTIGFASPKHPYAPINAVTLYRTDVQEFFTIAVPPPGWNGTVSDEFFLVKDEKELLLALIDLIQDVDVLSGWNSNFFDIPYIGKRLELLFGEAGLQKLALERGPLPRWTEQFKFKGSNEKDISLDLQSRVHLDYMLLFKKFNLEGRQSYALEGIAASELDGVEKISYEGSLYELYRNDFPKFLVYNRRDSEILVKLEEKFKYINLANTMVHEATVNFSAIFGSVQLIDTSMINYAHHKMNKIVFDRKHMQKEDVEGAVVLSPVVGYHRWIGSCDINSLYPSCYRSLNLSPEKIVGQLVEFEEGWKKVREARRDQSKRDQPITVKIEHAGEAVTMTIGELIQLIETEKYALSAYGTILDQSSGNGLLPAVLDYWFTGRKQMQAEKKKYQKLADEALAKANGNKEDPEYLKNYALMEYYDILQGVRKVLLNSSYGATLNEWCRFHDPRLGASTTGSGRQITTHMLNTCAQLLIGDDAPKVVKAIEYNRKGEPENKYTIACPKGLGPIYSDTDSCYFSMEQLVNNTDEAVALADAVVEQINDSFKEFMREAFFCQPGYDSLIRAVREVVAESGILRAKKKYVFYVRDMEGRRIPEGDAKELKTQGSDIKISSTPEVIREMLKVVTMMILKGSPQQQINDYIIKARRELRQNDKVNPLDYATITSVKTLDDYQVKYERIEKTGMGRVNLPSNVRATFNHNSCLAQFGDQNTRPIVNGDKIKIVWLKENEFGYSNIAFNSDTEAFPSWFTSNFEVDLKTTEQKLIDQKIKNIFDPIGWEVPTEHTVKVASLFEF